MKDIVGYVVVSLALVCAFGYMAWYAYPAVTYKPKAEKVSSFEQMLIDKGWAAVSLDQYEMVIVDWETRSDIPCGRTTEAPPAGVMFVKGFAGLCYSVGVVSAEDVNNELRKRGWLE